ncbi:MAG: hypothetical protein ABSC07_07020 [Terriglobales bacterium]|jgi:hypothetical protein
MLKAKFMFTRKKWLSHLIILAIAAVPVMAANNDTKPANENAANTSSAAVAPAAANPSPSPSPSLSPASSGSDTNFAALLGTLIKKGVLVPTEANAIQNAAPGVQFQLLVETLSRKGVLSAADLAAAQPSTVAAPVAASAVVSSSLGNAEPAPQASAAPMAPPPPPPPGMIPAIAPVRVFPVDPPKTGGLNGIKVGALTIAPYGFIKATVVHDSSDPDGDDFPFPGIWLNAGPNTTLNTGPTQDPEVHIKARSTRFGLNLEWPDVSKNLTFTGKIEGDFEGNFTSVDNADVSSIRNSAPRIRLAYARMDWHAGENTDIFFVGGQDWTLFGSGALMNIVETTFNGAYWGNIYTRSPQLRGGFIQTLSKENHVNLEGQFGIMMPSTGQIEKLCGYGATGGNNTCLAGFEAQQGQGEREGADSDRPEWEGRVALSFQLDKAKGVAPAQIAFAGFRSSRTSIVPNSSYCVITLTDTCTGAELPANETAIPQSYAAAFPNGFQASSKLWGGQIVAQLPTRWFTLVATAYKGGDLRFYFGGQINSYATDTGGLTGVTGPFVTADGGPLAASGAAVLGTNASGQVVVAPQRPVRSFGGFMQLGLPLSRWFNADPHGHNAGWQLQLLVGKDQMVDRDLNNPGFSGTLPMSMGKSAIATLNYKFNNWCGFSFEQSIYATRMEDHLNIYEIAGNPSNEWQDHRTEFGPIFTF